MNNPVHTTLQPNVDQIVIGERTFIIVGTAHVSKTSAELAETIIRTEHPDTVAIELCAPRYESLRHPDRWKNTDLVSVIRQGRAYVLMAQLVLAGYQKRLGNKLNIKPGAEMMRAADVATELNIPLALVDREVRITLRRTWAALGIGAMLSLIGSMFLGLFRKEEIEEQDIERLKSSDAMEELMRDFTAALPSVRTALIDERDAYLAAKIVAAPGQRVVAIVGAGHVPGIRRLLGTEIDLAPLEVIPPPSLLNRAIGWALPLLFIGLVIYSFFASGAQTSVAMLEQWVWINAFWAGFGALVVLAHPFAIVTAAVAAPFTAANPFLASGWFAGLVEAMIRKPRVADLETITEDIGSLKGIWHNRVSRILLVMASTNLFGSIGTIHGISKLWSLIQ